MKKPTYVDLGDLREDQRVQQIGHQAMAHDKKVAFVVETNDKADRYMRKLQTRFPGIVEISRGRLAEGLVYVKVEKGKQ